jgi:hypothetical protein
MLPAARVGAASFFGRAWTSIRQLACGPPPSRRMTGYRNNVSAKQIKKTCHSRESGNRLQLDEK